MSDILFKNHSIKEIETCIAKALTELLGHEAKVSINNLAVKEDTFGTVQLAKFEVDASVEPPKHFGIGVHPL